MNIAIAGFGAEGEQNYKYFSRDPENTITIFDEKQTPDRSIPQGVDAVLGEGVFGQLEGYDLVVRTASLSPSKIKTDGKIWSATNEFFEKCQVPIIGVTGTKGKGTISSLITSILEASGRKVWLVGNIGKPALSVLGQIAPNDIVVYELSSFQLWDIKRSPHISVIGLIEQDHLNVHIDMGDYIDAKANIRRYQTDEDFCIYHPTNQLSRQAAESSSRGQLIRYGMPEGGGVYIRDDFFQNKEQKICAVSALQLIGPHNVENACAAITVAKLLDIDNADIEVGLKNFKGLPHRLEFVRSVNGVDYYDDSISTTPGSAIAALRAFPGQQKIIILGGSSKGSDFSELAKELTEQDVTTLLIGEEASRIASACDLAGYKKYQKLNNLSEAVEHAHQIAKPGWVVILSPAAASFGMFKNYVHRGDQFKEAVNSL